MPRAFTATAWLIAAGVTSAAWAQLPESPQVIWLQENAVPIRTIDPHDDDFADLMPLVDKIGTARVVVLGEQSHGDGASYVAKHRLIRFLHERMGFDVLAWESGLFCCRQVDAALRSDMPIRQAADRGIFRIWTASGYVLDVLEYVRSTKASARPLELAGFDCQFSSQASRHLFPEAVERFFDRLDPAILRVDEPDGPAAAIRAIAAELGERPGTDWTPADEARRQAVRDLLRTMDERRQDLRRVHPQREIDFIQHCLRNLLIADEAHRQDPQSRDPAFNNPRDRAMAENLLWLAREYYRDRKIIIWAASFHLMRSAPSIDTLDRGLTYEKTVPMGQIVHEQLGADYYSIMFTAAAGARGNPIFGEHPLAEADPDTLEGMLRRAGRPYALVDFRSLPRDHWLRGPVIARPLGYGPMRADWTQVFDAVLFTREMFPATEDGELPEPVRTARAPASGPVVPLADLQALLDAFRSAVVAHDLGTHLKSGSAGAATAPVAQRSEPPLPEINGTIEWDARAYRFLEDDPTLREVTGSLAFAGPVTGQLHVKGSSSLVCLEGIGRDAVVLQEGPAALLCRGDLAGQAWLPSYATAYIEGDVSGELHAEGRLAGLITGRVTGRLMLDRDSIVHVQGGLDGEVSLTGGTLVIAGRTTREQLKGVYGRGRVQLEESDLPPGEHVMGDITVVVGQAETPAAAR